MYDALKMKAVQRIIGGMISQTNRDLVIRELKEIGLTNTEIAEQLANCYRTAVKAGTPTRLISDFFL